MMKMRRGKMKTFKELISEENLQEAFFGEFGELADKKRFDSRNPEINVKGVGKYKLEDLKRKIHAKLTEVLRYSDDGDYDAVSEMINQKGILVHFINAILDVERELQTPNMKRKVTVMKKEAAEKELRKNIINEVAPPDAEIEDFINQNKNRFVKQYGKEKGIQVLYSLAWKRFNEKK